ncbi:phage shock protein C (PspC) family protein [Nocardioides albertanoniae]|uniref:Phage shock protein C (PspC) family protein n=1 Tax=Nocardioides albertanoniae TaxID=1175486 RepID=A0A543A547_9ACTN|nr:PspC domain-containing protein [Nocardioides albertanoniae]TQL67721.1 phage shock protein C (PspC) family protein [Nocardioides albertanoniae]
MATTTLSRPSDNKWIAGVCAGLGDRFGIDANLIRLAFVISCLLPGPQFIVYIVLWIIMPKRAGY